MSAPFMLGMGNAASSGGVVAGPVEILLTGGTTWDVPGDWNDADNSIETWGAGAAGLSVSLLNSGGGGAGAYSKSTNVDLTPAATLDISVGATGDTLFDGTTLGNSTVSAEGGAEPIPNDNTVNGIGFGGLSVNGVGVTKFSGGNGGRGGLNRGGGGGGAAGPDGNGGVGGGEGIQAFPAGGAGANGGTDGGDGTSNPNTAGGIGNNGGGDGGQGTSLTVNSVGADGDDEARSGGGGGGTRNNGVVGGSGGSVGAGGGGSGDTAGKSVPGAGLIRIRYTPV